jgi:hypothetical protein
MVMQMQNRSRYRGVTLLECMLAMFILMVGIMGVLSALPTGINAAESVILQDVSIHLAHSKFSEFRRDKANYAAFNAYLGANHESINSSPGGKWRDFASGKGETYEFFDDIARYEWMAEATQVKNEARVPAGPVTYFQPSHATGTPLDLYLIRVTVHLKGTTKEFTFSQYMFPAR